MTDKKISQLASASLPLTGSEELPLVQSGATVKTTVADLSGGLSVIPVTKGGTGTSTTFTEGSAVFAGASGIYSQDNTNYFWDNTNKRLGIGTNAPTATLEIGTSSDTGKFIKVFGSATDTSYNVLSGAKQYPRIELIDTHAGGATHLIWNIGTQLRFGTGASSAGNAAFYIASGNAANTTFNGNVVIGTSGKGIDFSAASHAAGMTSELLDDYEEGTFTPTIVGTTSAGAGTYSEQNGYYTKVGNRVYVNIALAWSAHTGTGNMRISGLPFTNENVTGNLAIPSFWVADLALTAGNVIQGFVNTNGTQILLYQVPTGGGASTLVPIDTAATLRVSLQYQTAS